MPVGTIDEEPTGVVIPEIVLPEIMIFEFVAPVETAIPLGALTVPLKVDSVFPVIELFTVPVAN